MNFLKKYDINIIYEEIMEVDERNNVKLVDINKLKKIYIKSDIIKIMFPLCYNDLYSDIKSFKSINGYFTEGDILKIIFNYYNKLLKDNEIENLKKNKYFNKCETMKDILKVSNYCYIDDLILKNDIYIVSLGV